MRKTHFILLILFMTWALVLGQSEGIGSEKNPNEIMEVLKPVPVSVSGVVSDQEGEMLIGVNVLEEGTTNGTATDFNGQYSLDNVADDAVLVFSYVGLLSQEISVDGRTSIDVTLISDAQVLDELVVVGYGSVRKAI